LKEEIERFKKILKLQFTPGIFSNKINQDFMDFSENQVITPYKEILSKQKNIFTPKKQI